MSMWAAMRSTFSPSRNLPGHRMKNGTRIPPSYTLPFRLRSPLLYRTCWGPLSVMKRTIVSPDELQPLQSLEQPAEVVIDIGDHAVDPGRVIVRGAARQRLSQRRERSGTKIHSTIREIVLFRYLQRRVRGS